ncbi:hypothetical protein [Burkholderia gladioli]|nr:hypothetical protein [Burkholderia gladioli]
MDKWVSNLPVCDVLVKEAGIEAIASDLELGDVQLIDAQRLAGPMD